MKKFLFAAIVGLGIALAALMGCAGNPVTHNMNNLPPHMERLEALADTMPGDTITFRDYRDDGMTIWVWVDKGSVPGTCDYVVILGIVDKDKDKYVPLATITKRNSTNPCSTAYLEYEKYLEARPDDVRKGI